ncbi:CCR4-NOT transcription complex subunit 3-like isoform X4 [Ornithodoros turicata]|uniref:CCR4-NOT transcription complex subunit 3-like isoform X4 n=1 Tax=Ornithodoros turicata TaxID=34597 RepID=UPI003138E1FF
MEIFVFYALFFRNGEIERCLKKVSEGVEQFEDIWQKVYNATNTNQKEKYEADLKKEIKKLQRLRDQIKTWMASSEIKDKRMLMDNRKLIETQMERFKVVERETKTKAYSKEGLGGAQKVDPAQKEKEDITNWLATSIASLNIHVDQFECEIESLMIGAKKKKNDSQDRVDELKTLLERHRYHILQLETLMRALDNGTVEVYKIKKIKDDIEYYIESCQEPDFEENEFIYDDLDLREMTDYLAKGPAAAPATELGTTGQPNALQNSTAVVNSTDHSTVSSGTVDGGVAGEEEGSTEPSTNSSSPAPSPGLVNHSRPNAADVWSSQKPLNCSGPCEGREGCEPCPSEGALTMDTWQWQVSMTQDTDKANQPTKMQVVSHVPNMTNATQNSKPSILQPGSRNNSSTSSHGGTANNGSLTVNSHQNHTVASPPSTPYAVAAAGVNKAPLLAHGDCNAVSSGVKQNYSQQQQGMSSMHNSEGGPLDGIVNNVPSSPPLEPHHPYHHQASSPVHAMHNSNTTSGQSLMQCGSQSQVKLSNSTANMNDVGGNAPSTLYSMAAQAANTGAPGRPCSPSLVMNGPLPDKGRGEMSESMSSLKSIAQQAVLNAGLESHLQPSPPPTQSHTPCDRGLFDSLSSHGMPKAPSAPTGMMAQSGQSGGAGAPTPPATAEAHIPPLLGVAPLGSAPLSKECYYHLHMLESASMHMPHPSDSERLRPYTPRSPCIVPSFYPQSLPHCDTMDFFQKLPTEALFFVFYYMEGTKAQYLAAKALKKQSWRFHTKYMMWFQRHEEPKTITDEYEQGTYIYFDYEKWSQRRKEGFTFEYRYLEDRDLN